MAGAGGPSSLLPNVAEASVPHLLGLSRGQGLTGFSRVHGPWKERQREREAGSGLAGALQAGLTPTVQLRTAGGLKPPGPHAGEWHGSVYTPFPIFQLSHVQEGEFCPGLRNPSGTEPSVPACSRDLSVNPYRSPPLSYLSLQAPCLLPPGTTSQRDSSHQVLSSGSDLKGY